MSDGVLRWTKILRPTEEAFSPSSRIARLETSLQDQHQVQQAWFDATTYPRIVFSQRRIVDANKPFFQTFSWLTRDQVLGRTPQFFFGKRNSEFLKRVLFSEGGIPAGSAPVVGEVRFATPNDEVCDFEMAVSAVQEEDRQLFHATLVDITSRTSAARQLRESETFFHSLVESSGGPLVLLRAGTVAYANKACLELFGYLLPEELTGKAFSELMVGRDRKSALETIAGEGRKTGTVESVEFTGLRKDGQRISIKATAETMPAGLPAVLVHLRDTTADYKAQEESLRRAREDEILERILSALHGTLDVEQVCRAALSASFGLLGFDGGCVYSLDEDGNGLSIISRVNLPDTIGEALHRQPIQEGLLGYIAKTLEPVILRMDDYPSFLPHKSLFAAERYQTVVLLPLLASGALAGSLMLCSTKGGVAGAFDQRLYLLIGNHLGAALARAQEFERTKASEGAFRSVVESIPDVVYRAGPTGALLFVSPQVERLTGYLPYEFTRSPEAWRSIVHPDDRSEYSRRVSGQATGPVVLEYRVLPRGKASYRWVRDAVSYTRDTQGALTAITGVITDITEHVELARRLSTSEELKRNMIESVHEGVVTFDVELRYLDWNTAMERLTGVSRGDIAGKPAVDGPLPLKDLESLLRRALEGETVMAEDIVFAREGSAEEQTLWARFSPLRDQRGNLKGVVGTITNVTARKRLEVEVRESEETLRHVVDAMGDALLISDLEGKIWEVNREFTNFTGYTRQEAVGMTFPYPWLLEEEMATFVTWISELREKQELRDFDMRWKRKDGREVSISMNTTLLRNARGEPMAMLNIARDITDRKRMSTELATKNRQIEMLNRIISNANTTVEFALMFETIAEEVRHLLPCDHVNVGLVSDDGKQVILHAFAGRAVQTMATGDAIPIGQSVSKLAILNRQAVIVDDIAAHPDLGPDNVMAREGFVSQVSLPIFFNERILGALNVASKEAAAYRRQDLAVLQPIADQLGAMIDRSQLFRRVSDDSKYIHNLLNSIDSVVYTVDTRYRIREVNEAWKDFAGLLGLDNLKEEQAVVGRALEDVMPDPALWRELKQIMRSLFDRTLADYSREVVVGSGRDSRTFQLVITPMVIDNWVSGLVFTHTDITEIKRTEAEIRRRNRELLSLNTISSSIIRSLDLDEVMHAASLQTRDNLGAEIALCYVRDRVSDSLRLAKWYGLADSALPSLMTLDVAPAGSPGVRERRPLVISRETISDVRMTPTALSMFETLGLPTVVAVPLQSKGKVLGALVLGFAEARAFVDQQLNFLMLIGNQLGSAIETVQLYAEVQAQVSRMTALYQLSKGLTAVTDMNALIRTVFDEISASLPMETFAYDQYDQARGVLRRTFEGSKDGVTTPADGLLTPDVALSGASPLWTVVEGQGGRIDPTPDGDSLMAVPVRSKGTVVGILSLTRRGAEPYRAEHLRLVESIATLTELALDRVQLYDDIVAKSLEIESRNNDLDDFAYVVSHDLKEPLITIEGYSKILLGDYRHSLSDEGRQYLTSVLQSTARMKNLIEDLLTLSRIGRVTEAEETVPVGDLIQQVVDDLTFTIRERQAVVEVAAGMPTVRYNETHLGMVFRNLISNALKFNTAPHPTVRVGASEHEDHYEFSVADNGIGIAREHWEKIFGIFQRLHLREEFGGTGAGLTIVKKIIMSHNGRVWLESIEGKGTTFYFTVLKST
jgi:PAS domain S-box-containing protein